MAFTTNSALLDAPWFQSLVSIYFHLKINQRPGISLSPLARISFLIYVSVMFVLSNGKCMFPTPQIPESKMKPKYASFSTFLVTTEIDSGYPSCANEHCGEVNNLAASLCSNRLISFATSFKTQRTNVFVPF